jgi:hypothetical protein
MEAESISETSFDFNQSIGRSIPQDSHLHIRCREKLESENM